MRDAPAYDQIIQGLSGMMSVTGDAQTRAAARRLPVADTISGIMAAFAISGALVRRHAAAKAPSSTCPCSTPRWSRWAG
jgi:CoA:oxalate CoA-transferase